VATPFYLVIEPRSGRRVGGTEAGVVSESGFTDFLNAAVEKSKEQVGRLDEH